MPSWNDKAWPCAAFRQARSQYIAQIIKISSHCRPEGTLTLSGLWMSRKDGPLASAVVQRDGIGKGMRWEHVGENGESTLFAGDWLYHPSQQAQTRKVLRIGLRNI